MYTWGMPAAMRRPFTMGTYCPVIAGPLNEIACAAAMFRLLLRCCRFLRRGGDWIEVVGAIRIQMKHLLLKFAVALHVLFGTPYARHDLVDQCSRVHFLSSCPLQHLLLASATYCSSIFSGTAPE